MTTKYASRVLGRRRWASERRGEEEEGEDASLNEWRGYALPQATLAGTRSSAGVPGREGMVTLTGFAVSLKSPVPSCPSLLLEF